MRSVRQENDEAAQLMKRAEVFINAVESHIVSRRR